MGVGLPAAGRVHRGSLEHSQGVIDIGSNTVRLVIYSGEGRAPIPIFNERVACGLGHSLACSDRIDDSTLQGALDVLGRWEKLIRRMSLTGVWAVATAAVRESRNAQEFIGRASKALGGVPIEVISGDEEARRSALGVVFAIPDASGVVADLGGGSLELSQVASGDIRRTASLPLGALHVANRSGGDPKRAAKFIGEQLRQVEWLESSCAGRPLYVVGGLWRNLLSIHMEDAKHPLDVLHHYRIAADEARMLSKRIRELDAEQLKAYKHVSPDRVKHLLTGAQLLRKIAGIAEAEEVVVSGYGLREGMLYDALSEEMRVQDPLLEGAFDMCRRFRSSPDYGEEVAKWSACLLDAAAPDMMPGLKRLHLAACLLSEIVFHVHSDHRADVILQEILYSHLCGIDHPGRAFLAHAVSHRHNGTIDSVLANETARLLTREQLRTAIAIGKSLRLAHTIGAGVVGIVGRTRLVRNGDFLELRFPSELEGVRGQMVRKCLNALAQCLGLEARVYPD